jgi:nicotinate-nucleotide adenylyltransferase
LDILKYLEKQKKNLNVITIIWAITKKNPFKNKNASNLRSRIKYAKKIIKKEKFIQIKFFENKIKSNRTINLINYFKKINKKLDIYFIIGADNLINFHKWHKWKAISQKCNILVFDRQGYRAKSLKSITFKQLNRKSLKFIKFKKVNISSSQLRKI